MKEQRSTPPKTAVVGRKPKSVQMKFSRSKDEPAGRDVASGPQSEGSVRNRPAVGRRAVW